MNHDNRAKMEEQIKRMEGFRLRPYKDSVGIWTIGWGHNLESHGEVAPTDISKEDAERYFQQDLEEAINSCKNSIAWFNSLDEVRQAVLINLAFNLGVGSAVKGTGLLGFRNTLACFQDADWTNAARGMLRSKWAQQVEREGELVFMVLTGEWVR